MNLETGEPRAPPKAESYRRYPDGATLYSIFCNFLLRLASSLLPRTMVRLRRAG